MALIEHVGQKVSFLIINDNKVKEQNHAAIVSVEGAAAPKYTPLRWLGDDVPTDLEAVTAVPDVKNNFMAFTSAGRVFHFEINRGNNSVKVIRSFDVPQIPGDSDFEGFALQKVDNVLLAVWANRGLDAKPAQLFWGKFDLQSDAFTQVDSAFLKVPYPVGNTRHISDLKVDQTGAVFITSASDPGDDGPFNSAFYVAGTINPGSSPQRIIFNQSPNLTRLLSFDYHKVEAFEFVPGEDGGIVFGTDDENLGAAIYLTDSKLKGREFAWPGSAIAARAH